VFVKAVRQFWLENSAIWGLTHDYYAISSIGGFADPVPPLHRRSSNVPPVRWRQRRYARDVDTDQDPLAITEINQLIGRATGQQPRTHPTNQSAGQSGKQSSKCPGNRSGKQPAKRRRKRQQKQPEEPTPAQHGHNTKTCIPLPLEVVIMIVDAIYKNDNYSRPRIKDTRNLLEAFRWKLPDWYWQGRCRKDFIFEFDDLIKSGRSFRGLAVPVSGQREDVARFSLVRWERVEKSQQDYLSAAGHREPISRSA
jgi:hypothetical protein